MVDKASSDSHCKHKGRKYQKAGSVLPRLRPGQAEAELGLLRVLRHASGLLERLS